MANLNSNPVIENIRRALGRGATANLPPRPAVLPSRLAGDQEAEIDLLLKEINALSGSGRRLPVDELDGALTSLKAEQAVKKATVWQTPGLAELRITERLEAQGIEVISPHAGKRSLAECDLGITEVDFALPETGTIGLFSSPEKPREVSLVPRVHLALMRPAALRADLHQVFEEAKQHNYLIFITGPSRTADIELTTTLGVHGPKALYVWVIGESL
jgi:L-lactate dehydrogenase complex protein LldG